MKLDEEDITRFNNIRFKNANEPFVIADRVEELHGLHHPVHLLVLGQDQVVAGKCDAKDDGCHALETVDPLLAFGPTHKDKHFNLTDF
jgi:hypothetical protein